MPSVRPWQKDELAGLLPADWVWLTCSQQLQSIYSTARLKSYQQPTTTISTTPFLRRKTCLRPSNIQLWGFLPESRRSLGGCAAAHKKSRDVPYQGRNVSGQQPLQTHPTQTTAANTCSCRNSRQPADALEGFWKNAHVQQGLLKLLGMSRRCLTSWAVLKLLTT